MFNYSRSSPASMIHNQPESTNPIPRLLFVCMLLLLAFLVRLYRLNHFDISGDEAWSYTVASWPLAEIVSSDAETNPPLYHLLLSFSMDLLGDTPFAMRMLSVWFGILAVAFIARLGEAIDGYKLGLVSLALAGAAPFLIYYAQDARMYGPALLGAAGSLTSFVLLIKGQSRGLRKPKSLWVLYLATSLVGVYSHYYVFAVLFAQSAYIAWKSTAGRSWKTVRPWLSAWATMALLFIPWPIIHFGFLEGKASGRFNELTLNKLLEIARRTLVAYGAGVTIPQRDMWRAWLVVAIALAGLIALWSAPSKRKFARILSATLLASFGFAWLVNPIMPFFYERYLLVGMPAFVPLMAAGVLALNRWFKGLGVPAFLAILIISMLSIQNQFFELAFDKGGYGRLMANIDSSARPGDLILLNNPLQASLFDYYDKGTTPAIQVDRGLIFTDEETDWLISAHTAGYDRVWLIETGNPESFDPEHRVRQWLSAHGSRGFHDNYGNGNLLHMFVMDSSKQQDRIEVSADLNGEIALTSYQISSVRLTPGDTLLLTLFWQSVNVTGSDYTVFAHLVDQDGLLQAQTDGQPVAGTRPTYSWQQGDEIEDKHAILIPSSLPPGEYTLRVGMYRWPELTRLQVTGANRPVVDSSIILGSISVQ